MDINKTVEDFTKLEHEYQQLSRIQTIIGWDRRAMMPSAAVKSRSKTLGYFSGKAHYILTSPATMKILDKLTEAGDKLDKNVAVRVRIFKRNADRMVKIPGEMFQKHTTLRIQSETAWEKAKHANDWAGYRPYLEQLVDITKETVEIWGYEGSPYNALVSYSEEGMTSEKLEELFSGIKEGVVPLVKKIAEKDNFDDSFAKTSYPVDIQKKMNNELISLIGFDLERGCLAESEHPFCTSFGCNDVRLTTHYYENKFLQAFFASMHEAGHGMYEQNIPEEYEFTMLDRGLTGGMHESSSRFWENMVGRSLPFWKANLEFVRRYFPEQLNGIDVMDMYRAVNKVERSLIRMTADELTYNLHIMLRVELEKDLFEGRAKVADLAEMWNEKMFEYMGIRPENDTVGILQDVQWPAGMFGYFPSYTLGNLYNAQYSKFMKKELDFDKLVENREYDKILDWMRKNLYSYASLRTPMETMIALTGEEVNAKYLVEYLTDKFTKLYGV